MQGLTRAKQRANKNHFPQPAGYVLASTAQDAVDLQDARLAPVGAGVCWDPQDYLREAAL